jgi:hypothetical protein
METVAAARIFTALTVFIGESVARKREDGMAGP